jgi:hypothetical protein
MAGREEVMAGCDELMVGLDNEGRLQLHDEGNARGGGVLRMRNQGFHAKIVPPNEKNSSWAFFLEFGKSNMPNSWRGALFLLPILLWELANNKICQTKNSKLLEML